MEKDTHNVHFANSSLNSCIANFNCHDRVKTTYSSLERNQSGVFIWKDAKKPVLDTDGYACLYVFFRWHEPVVELGALIYETRFNMHPKNK